MRAWITGLALMAAVALNGAVAAADTPYGTAENKNTSYKPARVVYDVGASRPGRLANVLDRVSMLQNLYGTDPFDASIVVVVHGGAIPLFATRNLKQYKGLMERASSLTASDVIEFRMCGASARLQGFEAADIHGFVTVVPMADAEIVRLQHQGYAYMR